MEPPVAEEPRNVFIDVIPACRSRVEDVMRHRIGININTNNKGELIDDQDGDGTPSKDKPIKKFDPIGNHEQEIRRVLYERRRFVAQALCILFWVIVLAMMTSRTTGTDYLVEAETLRGGGATGAGIKTEMKVQPFLPMDPRTKIERVGQFNHSEIGYVTSVYDESQLCGAIMLAWALKSRDPNTDLVAVVSGMTEKTHALAIDALQKAGFKVYKAPLLKKPDNLDKNYEYAYTTMNVFGLEGYSKLMFLDADYFLPNGPPASVVANLFSKSKPAAFRDCNCDDPKAAINSGFMMYHPSPQLLLDMKDNFGDNKMDLEGDTTDQAFLDAFFKRRRDGFEYIPPETGFWANYGQKGSLEEKTKRDMLALRFYGSKPWECPRGHHCACSEDAKKNMMWPAANDFWWERYDTMATTWKWMKEPEYEPICIAKESSCIAV